MNAEPQQKVLLVEDEALIRIIGSDALEDAGYEVISVGNADEALRYLEKFSEVTVLFTDIRMPGSMDGLALARLVHDRWPKIRLLLTSGDTWPPRAEIPDDGRFLAKPYRIEILQNTVDELAGRT